MKRTRCPMCQSNIIIRHKPWLGQNIRCPSCEAILEVVFLNPLELDWTFGVQDYKYDNRYFEEYEFVD
jgi:lysine biosynthesis protein LysW